MLLLSASVAHSSSWFAPTPANRLSVLPVMAASGISLHPSQDTLYCSGGAVQLSDTSACHNNDSPQASGPAKYCSVSEAGRAPLPASTKRAGLRLSWLTNCAKLSVINGKQLLLYVQLPASDSSIRRLYVPAPSDSTRNVSGSSCPLPSC